MNGPDAGATPPALPHQEAVAFQLAQLRGEGPLAGPASLRVPSAERGAPIGKIGAVRGEAVVSRVDQTSQQLDTGSPVYQGDIIATRAASGAEVEFTDGTIGHLGPEASMLVQEFPTGIGASAPVVFVVSGPFSFAGPPGGSIAANALTVRTPVASVRLEGGRLVGRAAPEAVENRFTLLRHFDGTLGRAVIATASATFVLGDELATAQVISLFRAPSALPEPSFAQLEDYLGGSVFDWLGLPQAGGGGGGPNAVGGEAGNIVVTEQSPVPPPALEGTGLPVGGWFGSLLGGSLFGSRDPLPSLAGSGRPDVSAAGPPVGASDSAGSDPFNISLEAGDSTVLGTPGIDTVVISTDPVNPRNLTISADANGQVVVTDGVNTITIDDIEELEVNFGSGDDEITILDLSNTDILNSTIRLNMGAGDDTVNAAEANRRIVADGGTGDDRLTGGSQNDNLSGGPGNDILDGQGGNDVLSGGSGDDTIAGGDGDDMLDGGSGDDTLSGGRGDDTYIVDGKDVVNEPLGAVGGTDTVFSSVSFSLDGTNIENLTLTGSDDIDATGAGPGLNQDNILVGNAGNNRIDGGFGADTMSGGAGDDIFVVDNARDTVSEGPGGGTDSVLSSVSFALGPDIEHLTLTGSARIDGTGNVLDNTLTGNDGDNVLAGGAGDDTYIVQNARDAVVERAGEGVDTVKSSVSFRLPDEVEHLTLTGSENIDGAGNALENTLVGNGGDNVLWGANGSDTLTGDDGADSFYYAAPGEGGDTVADFETGVDSFLVLRSAFGGNALGMQIEEGTNFSTIDAAYDNTNGTSAAAGEGEPGFIFDTSQGILTYDADGNGGEPGFTIATVSSTTTVAADDVKVAANSPL